jgi:hypothetical protein
MNDLKAKISVHIAQILAGLIFGMILGIVGLIICRQIGGNYVCFPIINLIYGSYISFSGLLGLISGAVFGVFVFSRLSIKNCRRVIMIFGLIVLLLFVLYVFLYYAMVSGHDSMKQISWSLLDYVDYALDSAWYLFISFFGSVFILLPLGISLIITLLFNLVQYLLDYFHVQKQY